MKTTNTTTPRKTPRRSQKKATKMTPKALILPDSNTGKENVNSLVQSRLDAVYKLVRRRTGNLGGGGAGGAIYGEVTQKSFARVVNMLKAECEFNSSSTFIDIGAGLGKPNLHVALDPGVKGKLSRGNPIHFSYNTE